MARRPDARGIADAHGRLMVVMVHNTDMPDAWEREGEDRDYFFRFSPEAYAVGDRHPALRDDALRASPAPCPLPSCRSASFSFDVVIEDGR